MATPFLGKIGRGLRTLIQTLGSIEDPFINDEEDLKPGEEKELEEINKISASGVSNLENAHGKQIMVVDNDKGEETDRLGHKKPKGTTERRLSQEQNKGNESKENHETSKGYDR